ncbi:hypothetical protein LBMAG53_18810 [Planctomycetota bacterium]|nr:hypothetical protein LBMAG53_18810 [Planctomycetota bacterium]
MELDPNISANDGGTLLVTVRNQSSSPIEFFDMNSYFFHHIFLGNMSGFSEFRDAKFNRNAAFSMDLRRLPPGAMHSYRVPLKNILPNTMEANVLHTFLGEKIFAFISFIFIHAKGGSRREIFSPIVELRNIPNSPAPPPDPSSTADPGQAVPLDDNRRIEKTLSMPRKS